MAYQALARKYRPQTFADIIGQQTLVRTLQNAIEQQRIHHAYLFSGVRGIGKTTSARILAKALNCAKGPTLEPCNECTMCREITEGIDLDVREIDAATYTGVDNIRDLREVTQFQPARDRHRIFVIDEAHMLSPPAWNALLKILEEPPPHVIFMFATTEIQKVPQTILSRVQKFSLRKITLEELIGRLSAIAAREGIDADREALEILARRGEGSMRDALSLLDQVIAFSGRTIRAADVATVLGLSETSFFARLLTLVSEGDHAGILEAIDEAAATGRDFKMLYRDLLSFVRNLLLIAGGVGEAALSASPEDLATIRAAAGRFSYTELLRIANLLLRDDETVNRSEHQRLAVEIALLKAATFPRLRAVEEVLGSSPAASSRVSAPGAKAPKAQREPAVESREPRSNDPQAFVEHLRKTRPLFAGYLAGAKSIRKEENRLVFVFDDPHLAQPLLDARADLEQGASDVYGAPTAVLIETASQPQAAGRRAEETSPLRDDPVVKAFAKHLGGEIVKEKR
ncbi:MAG TPA: DNA polymerase III subunit gamma/tau [Thermoanaerobaculia bacterium]|nr:DNA polymerase III subunit gamma/tau [Thermoanaerobaculia bacterium]